ncbi:MAG: hypothetical protein ACOVOR_04135, partial [Rhabdochlamydiaceae bacterium]
MNSVSHIIPYLIHPGLEKKSLEDENFYRDIALRLKDSQIGEENHLKISSQAHAYKYSLYTIKLDQETYLVLTVAKIKNVTCSIFLYKIDTKDDAPISIDLDDLNKVVDDLIFNQPSPLPDLNSSSSHLNRPRVKAIPLKCADQYYIQTDQEFHPRQSADPMEDIESIREELNKGTCKPESVLHFLCRSDEGIELLKDHRAFFTKRIEQEPQLLSLPFNREGRDKGTTPFYWLCRSRKGLEILRARWPFFADKIQQEPQLLSCACIGDGPDKGTTPFYWLCQLGTGLKLLKARWSFFAPLIKQEPQLLSLACIGESSDKGKTPFYLLCATNTGREILKDHWSFFAPLIKQEPQLLSLA